MPTSFKVKRATVYARNQLSRRDKWLRGTLHVCYNFNDLEKMVKFVGECDSLAYVNKLLVRGNGELRVRSQSWPSDMTRCCVYRVCDPM